MAQLCGFLSISSRDTGQHRNLGALHIVDVLMIWPCQIGDCAKLSKI